MAILAYDYTALVEPNLLIPGKKPIGSVSVDPQHKYTPTNFWLCNGSSVVDLVTGQIATNTGSVVTNAGNLKITGVQDSNYVDTQDIQSSNTGFDFVLQMRVKSSGANSQSSVFQWANTVGSGSPFLFLALQSNPTPELRLFFDNSYIYTSSANYLDTWLTITIVGTSGGVVYVFEDEAETFSNSRGAWANSNSDDSFWIGNGFADGLSVTLHIEYVAYWTGYNYPSLSQIPNIVRDPYQFLIPDG